MTEETTIIPGPGANLGNGGGTYRPPGVTILHHPNLDRVGAKARFLYLTDGKAMAINRSTPVFRRPGEARGEALGLKAISRSPLSFESAGEDAVELRFDSTRFSVHANGQLLASFARFSSAQLDAGVPLMINETVVLLLHAVGPIPKRAEPTLDMVGESACMEELRRQVRVVAATDFPVLLSGESGTGKELVAQAIHRLSVRGAGPFQAVNLAAVNPQLAASELFGHERGAFSGATGARSGLFRSADHGTLLLDEIGDTPFPVQTALLRALETGEVRPVGSSRSVRVDVRVLAATDVDLAHAASRGEVKSALIERVAGITVEVPSLSRRREDIPLLLNHFLRAHLDADAQRRLLSPGPDGKPWIPARVIDALVRYEWPRNVRELRNVAQEIAVLCASRPFKPASKVSAILEWAQAADLAPPPPPPPPPPRYRRPEDVPREELVEALRAHGFAPKKAREMLRLSQQGVYRAMALRGVRMAGQVDRAEFERELAASAGDLDRMSERLQMSKRALAKRQRELGL